MIQLVSVVTPVRSPAQGNGLSIQSCHGYGVGYSCSSDSTPGLETSICRGHGAKKEGKKNQELRDCFYGVYFFRFHQEVRSCNFFLSAFAERDFWLWLLGRALEGKMFSECEGSRARWIWVQIPLLPLLVFCFFRTKPKACRSSQARGPIRAAAAGLHHSHSNTGN